MQTVWDVWENQICYGIKKFVRKNPRWEEKKSTTFTWNQEEVNGKRCGDVIPEPLIAEYDLNAWKNRQFKDSIDINKNVSQSLITQKI